MASKEQYEFFKSQYDEENTRNNELTKRAEVYLSIISLFLTAFLLKIKDIFETVSFSNGIITIIFRSLLIFSLASFSISLFLLIGSLKIRNYEGVIDFDAYVKKNDNIRQDNEDFFDDRISDYIVATERNEKTNDEKAYLLIKSRIFILIGFLLTTIFIIALLTLKKQ